MRTLRCLLSLLAFTSVSADTVQDFDTLGTAYTLVQFGAGAGATVQAGGPSGNFLRLASGSAGDSLNTIGFDRTDTGAHCTVTVDLDFRITPGTGSADGFGIALLNTADYTHGGGAFGAEEPDFARSVGVGFDIYANPSDLNDNHVSVHFDGSRLTEIDASGLIDLDGTGGQFAHVRIVIDADDDSGDVTVEITPPSGSPTTLIDAFPVPGLRPYEGRLQIGARTGGQTADHDFDNIGVTFGACPGVAGQWGAVLGLPTVAIHADLLPNGLVLFWDRDDTPDGDKPPGLFDPATEQVVATPDPGYDLFCSGHSYLPDGTLFVTGGHDGQDQFGLDVATYYDFMTGNWTTEPETMNAGRWYPTNTTLANGDTLVVTGTSVEGVINTLPQVFELATRTWRDLTNAVVPTPLYSFMHLAPNGMVVITGPQTFTQYLDTSGSGAWIDIGPTGSVFRDFGTSVVYDYGQALIAGGGNPPVETAQVLDLLDASPQWQFTEPMSYKRRQLNATILPDGQVLVTGGTGSSGFNTVTDAVFAAELWDPATGSWSVLSAAQIPRIYHSFALLLPDGRVLTGGGGHPPGVGGPPGDLDHYDAEIYSPPYLFRGPRPVIAAAPSIVGQGESFLVESPDKDSIAEVNLVRLSAVTHSFNQNQGIARLSFINTPAGLLVDAPSDLNLAQPGHYMLFVLDAAGVPSVSSMVQLLPDAGRVPDGDAVDGTQLTVNKTAGNDLVVSWGESCNAGDIDYAVYEGTGGDFTTHIPLDCAAGATTLTFAPASGFTYYLVAPRNTVSQGSLGMDSFGAERSGGSAACLPQSVGACAPPPA